MTDQTTLFAFDEADHLTRIHLKLALEDVGFSVREHGDTVAIVPPVGPDARQTLPQTPISIASRRW